MHLALVAAVLFLAAPAPAAEDEHPGDRFELTMGFFAGQSSYATSSFAFDAKSSDAVHDVALSEVFRRAPYARVATLGPRWDFRWVYSGVRMTAGVQWGFSSFAPTAPELSDAKTVSVQSISPLSLRFALGGEVRRGPITGYLDLVGEAQRVRSALAVDGASTTWEARTFGFLAAPGLRIALRPNFFAAAAAEVGLVGPVRWGGQLLVGGTWELD